MTTPIQARAAEIERDLAATRGERAAEFAAPAKSEIARRMRERAFAEIDVAMAAPSARALAKCEANRPTATIHPMPGVDRLLERIVRTGRAA